MTETEYIIYTITGIVAVVVGRLCYVRIYKYGKSRKQRRAERWRDQGGVAQGTIFDADLLRAGDPSLEGEDLQEDLLPGEVSLQRPWDDLYGVSPFSFGLSQENYGFL